MTTAPPSPRAIAIVWLLYFLTAILGAVLTKGIVVSADAAATANNILSHASVYQAGIGLDLVSNLLYLALTALLFGLFRPVNPNLALIAAVFGLVGGTVQIVGGLLRIAPPVILANHQLGTAFGTQQVQAAALLSLTLYNTVFQISFVLFGSFMLFTGLLILRSTFLPRWLGWWWVVAGTAALIFLWPPLATKFFPLILAADTAELALLLWLLVKGVDTSKWRAQGGISAA
ncbi:MAG: DUF4386 domain-containing protein [Gemmatimonadaceae bacterium]